MSEKETAAESELKQAIKIILERQAESERRSLDNQAAQLELQERQVAAFEALRGSQPPREVKFSDADYQKKFKDGFKHFKTPTWQNDYDCTHQAHLLQADRVDDIIDRVSKLRAGHYLGGKVQVQVNMAGAVRFVYTNKTPDDRMALPFKSFEGLVDAVWAEMHASAAA